MGAMKVSLNLNGDYDFNKIRKLIEDNQHSKISTIFDVVKLCEKLVRVHGLSNYRLDKQFGNGAGTTSDRVTVSIGTEENPTRKTTMTPKQFLFYPNHVITTADGIPLERPLKWVSVWFLVFKHLKLEHFSTWTHLTQYAVLYQYTKGDYQGEHSNLVYRFLLKEDNVCRGDAQYGNRGWVGELARRIARVRDSVDGASEDLTEYVNAVKAAVINDEEFWGPLHTEPDDINMWELLQFEPGVLVPLPFGTMVPAIDVWTTGDDATDVEWAAHAVKKVRATLLLQ